MKSPIKLKKYSEQHIYGKDRILIILTVVSSCFSIVFFLLAVTMALSGASLSEAINWYDLMVIGLLTIIGPIGFYSHLKIKKKRQLEEQLPDFLREISGSTSSGMTIYDAIRSAAEGDHGGLTPELRRMSSQLSWGISIKDALENFAKRIKTDSVKRMTLTVNKALEIGGNTSAVFNAAAKEIDQVKNVEQQRRMEMSLYSTVIFISFFVFLAVILIIDKTIFAAIMDLQDQMAGQAMGTLKLAPVDHEMLKATFFSFVLVQSIGGGMLGGFMMDGKLSSGIRFGFILVIVSFFIFKFLF